MPKGVSSHYDLPTAVQNIDAEITTTKQALADLEATKAMIEEAGEKTITLITILNRYGRRPASSDNGLTAKSTPTDVVLAMINQADHPLRVDDIMTAAATHGRRLDVKTVRNGVKRLTDNHKIARASHGLYTKLSTKKGTAIVAAVAAEHASKPEEELSKQGQLAKLDQLVLKFLDTREPRSVLDVAEQINVEDPTLLAAQKDTPSTIRRSMQRLGIKKFVKHGNGPHTQWTKRA